MRWRKAPHKAPPSNFVPTTPGPCMLGGLQGVSRKSTCLIETIKL